MNLLTTKALSRRKMMLAGTATLAGGAGLLQAQTTAPAENPVAQRQEHPSVDAQGQPYTDQHWDQPGEPGRDYTPMVVPNGWTLPYKIVEGVKVFHLVAEEVPTHEFAPGLVARCWGYNGSVHGPAIEAVEGDRVRIYVTNRLPAPTTIHWHGILLPSGMDGVGGLSQPNIPPGQTYVYEFTLRQNGTHFYHPHHDEMTQMAMGMMGLFVIHPRRPQEPRIDRDFAIMLQEWRIDPGTYRPNPNEMLDFNLLTFNAKAFPGTAPLVARLGQRVRIRFANGSATNHHPIHLHGYQFWISGSDGGRYPPSAQQPDTTVLVPIGSAREIEFVADEPGDWALHCHMTHHTMNQMGHEFPNMIGVDASGLDRLIKPLLPAYMTMGQTGMGDMGEMLAEGHMRVPENSIPMIGGYGPFDYITMGGMFTVFKVRRDLPTFDDPGWYDHPQGTVAWQARPTELQRDGVAADGSSAPTAPDTARRSARIIPSPATRDTRMRTEPPHHGHH